MDKLGYVEGIGIIFKNAIKTIHTNKNILQPVFEAFTNSIEAIDAYKQRYNSTENGNISIELHHSKNLLSKETSKFNFQKIIITDTGIGFEEVEFIRLINLRDDRKGFLNKGTGRVQFLHRFDETIIESVYRDNNSSTGFSKRIFTLSKKEAFLNHNAIIRIDEKKEIKATKSYTKLLFKNLLDQKEEEFYSTLTAQYLKEEIIKHYLALFCEKLETFPTINIKRFIDNKLKKELSIVDSEIPKPVKENEIEIYYSKVNGNAIEKTLNKEKFNLKSFVITKDKLDKNGIKLISKGEIAKELDINDLKPQEEINGNRYLLLLSGKYIDERDSDTRGEINIPKKKDFKEINSNSLFGEEEILFEDIVEKTNQTIVSLFKEIEEKKKEKEKSLKDLQEMFLLNPKTINTLRNKITINDTDVTILRKVYEAEAEIVAVKDAEIKKQVEELRELDTTTKNYKENLKLKVNDFIRAIPQQNRTALSQYVARRKMVLELFDKILQKEIEKLKSGGRIDEDLMHNLIFQQHSNNPEDSDLWLIAEEFIYYKGFSEEKLNQIEIDGIKIFNKNFTEEEERYLNSLGEKRLTKRPDILLFPEEGKCIIIELKAPDVNVAEHLSQIDFYANLIRNYTIDVVQITTFYGYLIGENIEDRDVRGRVSRFEHSYQLDYWFRPSENVQGFDGRTNGSIYTEVLKYSTLLERARIRNKIFIDKLVNNNKK